MQQLLNFSFHIARMLIYMLGLYVSTTVTQKTLHTGRLYTQIWIPITKRRKIILLHFNCYIFNRCV